MKQKRNLNPWIVWVSILIPGLIFNAISFHLYRKADNDLVQVELYEKYRNEKFDETMNLLREYEECLKVCMESSDDEL